MLLNKSTSIDRAVCLFTRFFVCVLLSPAVDCTFPSRLDKYVKTVVVFYSVIGFPVTVAHSAESDTLAQEMIRSTWISVFL